MGTNKNLILLKGDICITKNNIIILESINGSFICHNGICGLTSGFTMKSGVMVGEIVRMANDKEKNIILTNLNKLKND